MGVIGAIMPLYRLVGRCGPIAIGSWIGGRSLSSVPGRSLHEPASEVFLP